MLRFTLPDLPADHVLIPSFAMRSAATYGFAFALRHDGGEARLSHIGERGADSGASVTGSAMEAPIDCFVTRAPIRKPVLEIRVDSLAAPTGATLLSISLRPWSLQPQPGALLNEAPLRVPSISQMELPQAIRHGACSPVCVAMAMAALGQEVDAEAFSNASRHEGIFGVWPANLYAASRRGVLGCIEAFTRVDDVVPLLAAGMPVIASTRWSAGDLSHGAIAQSGGHLILVRGFGSEVAWVNDPAADVAANVARDYARDEFCRIWLRERGAAYVLLP